MKNIYLSSLLLTFFISMAHTTNGQSFKLVKDIKPGKGSSNPGNLTNVNGTLHFSVEDGPLNYELWKSDGTAEGTALIKVIGKLRGGLAPGGLFSFTNVNGTLFFIARLWTGGFQTGFVAHDKLWKSDGTADGTVIIDSKNPVILGNINGVLYFSSDLGFFKSDGTTAGTKLIKNIYPYHFTPYYFANVNGTLFLSAADSAHGPELWKSDDTRAGTVLVKDIYPGFIGSFPTNLTNVNGTLYFIATDADSTGLWKSDGTKSGTVLLKHISPGQYSPDYFDLTNVNGELYFFEEDQSGYKGYELFKSDGTAAGTVLVKDIYPGYLGDAPSYSMNLNGKLLFTATDYAQGNEIWRSNGTAKGTVVLKDICPDVSCYGPDDLTNINGTLYFSASDGNGNGLWKSDGTRAGTVLVKEMYGPGFGTIPYNISNANGRLYFNGYDPDHGVELWKSDGTAAGTVLAQDIDPGTGSSNPGNITVVNGITFLTATTLKHGTELYAGNTPDITPSALSKELPVIFNDTQKIISPATQLKVAPNPFSNSTTISFFLPQSEKVSIQIFDVTGRLIKTLASAEFQAGTHQTVWSAGDEKGNAVSAGIYFLRMQTGNYSATKKIIMIK